MKLIDVLKLTNPFTVIRLHNKDLLNFATITADLLLDEPGFDCYHDREVIGINPGNWLIDQERLENSLFIAIDY